MKKILLLIAILFLAACSDETQNPTLEQSNSKQSSEQSREQVAKSKGGDEAVKYADLTEFKVLSISEGLLDNAPALQINLSLPADNKQDLSQLIDVHLNNKKINKGEWVFSDTSSVLYFPFIVAQTQYKISISDKLLASNGKKLNQSYNKKLITRNYQKSVRFTSKGSTLLKDSNVLPIEAVNVEAVDLKFWRIHSDKYSEFLNMSYRSQIYSLERLYKIADVVYTAQFDIDSVENKRETHDISIKHIEQVQKAGLYFVTISPVDMYSYNIESTWFMSTDIGLHTRKYKDSLVVFTHKIPEAKIYPNIDITVLDKDGIELASAKTDKDGFAEIKLSDMKKARLVIAQKGDNFNLIRLTKPQMDLSEFNLSNRAYHPQELFLYAPRDLYRPGETVNINGLLRDDDGEYVMASPIKVEIKRPDSRTYKTFDWQGDETSLYSSEFEIPNGALTGNWSFVATLANKDKFIYDFAVEDFMPERLKLELTAGNESLHVNADDSPVIKVQSDYLYGAPAANNRYDATVTISAENRLFDNYNDFSFGASKYRDFNYNFDVKQQTLNAEGYGEIKLKNEWNKTKFPLRIISHVNVYESGGRPVSRKITQTIWPYDMAIGIRPLWDDNYASPNSNNQIEIIAINQKGEKINANNVDVLLIRENDNRYWHWGDNGWSYSSSENNLPVFNKVINVNKDLKTTVSLPIDYGNYRVEIRNKAKQLLSSYKFFSGWTWYDAQSNNGERPDRVKLAWNADTVTAGTMAQLKITAPYAGTALITIESNQILYKQSINMSSPSQTVEIPIDSGWKRHDIYASVMVIRKGEIKRKHLPARSFGILHLPLNRDHRELEITIDNPDKVLPETTVTIKIKAENLNKNNTSYVTLAAVDTGVLSVSNFKTPNPFTWFFAKREYLAELRDMYGSIIALGDGKNARQKFGGDEDINRGGDAPTNDVQIVSIFNEKVQFNAQGIAEVTFDLPYFNGELRLMAMAYNKNQFASNESRMKVAAPIVVSASLPRFIAKGDESYATIDVHNTEDFEQVIKLHLSGDEALGAQKSIVELRLNGKEKNIIQLPIVATVHSGIGSINVKAEITGKNNYSLDRQWNLGIRPAFPAVSETKQTLLAKGRSFDVKANSMDKFDDSNFKTILKVSNTPVLNAEQHLHNLIQYPYGCLEQTSSRVWPLLTVKKSDLSLFNNEKQHEIFDKRGDLINDAVSRLLGMQRYDGSFGLWNNNSHEEKWLTVYVTDLLLNIKKLGYNVPEKSLTKAIKRLGTYVKGRNRIQSDLARYLSNKEHYLIAYKAYAAYVLAGIKQVSLQDVRKLYDNNNKDSKSPLPFAHLAMALEIMGDDRRATQAWLKAVDFKVETQRYRYYGDYGTTVRDLSQVILLGQNSQLSKDLTTTPYALIEPLLDAMKGKRWLSTQERGSLFRLAKSLQNNKSDENWLASIVRNEQTDEFNQTKDLIKVWSQKAAKTNFSISNNSESPLFIDFKTQGYLKKSEATSNGITVTRNYYDIKGNKLDVSQLKTGDMVFVHLQVRLDKKYNYLPDAMVVELLPAGLELENQNLEHAFPIDDLKLETKSVYTWRRNNITKHQEYRDDRFISAATLSRYYPTNIFYLARAVTPGVYTIPPTLVEDMYRPEIRAIGADDGKMVIVE